MRIRYKKLLYGGVQPSLNNTITKFGLEFEFVHDSISTCLKYTSLITRASRVR